MATSHRRSNSLPQPHVGLLLQQEQREDLEILYSSSDEKTAKMNSNHHRRTRPKTPVFAVGQLERASMIRQLDTAQLYADGYQFVLPPRIVTPSIDIKPQQKPKRTPKTLRKVKCQLSLRDLVKDQDQYHDKALPAVPPPTSSYSDVETLVGSDSAPCSPGKDDEVFYLAPTYQKPRHSTFDDSITLSDFNNDVGLKICIDLLTNELASSLFKQHPAEAGNRASGLQILLMIEAYETVQQHVRRQLEDRHVTGRGGAKENENVDLEGMERILDHWLQVLYLVYNRSQELRSEETVRSDDWLLHNMDEEVELSYH